jgi:hypothetical protein
LFPDVFESDFVLPKLNGHPLVCLKKCLTPAGMLLADWLVCERDAFPYSFAKERIFVTMR